MRRAIQVIVKDYARGLNLDPHFTVHSLRVTALTTARQLGSDIINLRDFAGHADPPGRRSPTSGTVTSSMSHRRTSSNTQPCWPAKKVSTNSGFLERHMAIWRRTCVDASDSPLIRPHHAKAATPTQFASSAAIR